MDRKYGVVLVGCGYMGAAKLEDGSIMYYESGWGNTIALEDLKEFIGSRGRSGLHIKKIGIPTRRK